MPDLSAETFKRTSLLLDAVIRSDAVRHERGGSTGEEPPGHVKLLACSHLGSVSKRLLLLSGVRIITFKSELSADPWSSQQFVLMVLGWLFRSSRRD